MAIERLKAKPFMSQAGKKLSNDSYTVRISHGEWNVEGISKNPLNFKLSAKYADLFNGLIPGAELLQKTGNASLTTGIFSQKYFQGGNNLDMNVEFRIYDDGKQDINPVVKGARHLSNMAVAKGFQEPKNINDAIGVVERGAKKVGEKLKKVASGDATVVEAIGGGIQDAINRMNSRAVTLTVMDMFNCTGMVVQDVSVTYSPTLTHTGPLYGDFSVGLISLRAITQGNGTYGVDSILQGQNYNIMLNGKDSRLEFNYKNNISSSLGVT